MSEWNGSVSNSKRSGRGRRLGWLLLAAGAVLVVVAAIVLFSGILGSGPDPDNTEPVTELPPASAGPTGSLPLATPYTSRPSGGVPPPVLGTDAATPAPTASPTASPTATGPVQAPADVALTRWNWYADQQLFSVAGYVDGVESGGTCLLTAGNGERTIEAAAPAQLGETTTNCIVNIAAADVEAGVWTLQLHYERDSETLSSEIVQVTVP